MSIQFVNTHLVLSDGHLIALQTCTACGACVMYDPRDERKPTPVDLHIAFHQAGNVYRLPVLGEVGEAA